MRKGQSGKTKTVLPGLSVPMELEQRVRERARTEDVTLSEIMRRGLELYLYSPVTYGTITPDERREVESISREVFNQEVAELRREIAQLCLLMADSVRTGAPLGGATSPSPADTEEEALARAS